MKNKLSIFFLFVFVAFGSKTINDSLYVKVSGSGKGGSVAIDSGLSVGKVTSNNSPTHVLVPADSAGEVKRCDTDSLSVGHADGSDNSDKLDGYHAAYFDSLIAFRADSALARLYASLHSNDTVLVDTIPAGPTYHKLSCWNDVSSELGYVADTANDQIIVTSVSAVFIYFHMPIYLSGGAGTTVYAAVFCNGVEVNEIHDEKKFQTINTRSSIEAMNNIVITEVPCTLDVRVRTDNVSDIILNTTYGQFGAFAISNGDSVVWTDSSRVSGHAVNSDTAKVLKSTDTDTSKFGDSGDALLVYNGSNFILNPDVLGTGTSNLLIGNTGELALQAGNIGIGAAPNAYYGVNTDFSLTGVASSPVGINGGITWTPASNTARNLFGLLFQPILSGSMNSGNVTGAQIQPYINRGSGSLDYLRGLYTRIYINSSTSRTVDNDVSIFSSAVYNTGTDTIPVTGDGYQLDLGEYLVGDGSYFDVGGTGYGIRQRGASALNLFDGPLEVDNDASFTTSETSAPVSLLTKESGSDYVYHITPDSLISNYISGTDGYIAEFNATGGVQNSPFYNSSGKIGLGTTSPDGKLHVMTASSGTVTANGAIDDLVVENGSDAGISILSPDSEYCRLALGSPSDNVGASLAFKYNEKVFYISTSLPGGEILLRTDNNSDAMRIDSNGTINIETIANAGADVDKFLVHDASKNIDYRTGAEVLSDIGGMGKADFDDSLGNHLLGDGNYYGIFTSGLVIDTSIHGLKQQYTYITTGTNFFIEASTGGGGAPTGYGVETWGDSVWIFHDSPRTFGGTVFGGCAFSLVDVNWKQDWGNYTPSGATPLSMCRDTVYVDSVLKASKAVVSDTGKFNFVEVDTVIGNFYADTSFPCTLGTNVTYDDIDTVRIIKTGKHITACIPTYGVGTLIDNPYFKGIPTEFMPSDSVLLPLTLGYSGAYYDGFLMLKPGTNYAIVKYIANRASVSDIVAVPGGASVTFPIYKGTGPTDNHKMCFDWFLD